MKEFKFDEAEHIYTLDGKPLIGTTTALGVIAKPALIPWAVKVCFEWLVENFNGELTDSLIKEAKSQHKKIKESSADIGTEVHKAIEEWIKENKEPKLNEQGMVMFNHFKKWAIDNNIKFIESEKQVYDEDLWIAGTIDLVFEKDGKTYLGDIKTYSGIYDRTPFFQCAGYRYMYEKTTGKKLDGSCIIRLGKDGSFEEKWSYDYETDLKGFTSAVELYKALKTY
jgi:hypothetical protein